MKQKRMLATFLAIGMSLSCLSGCENAQKESETKPQSTEPAAQTTKAAETSAAQPQEFDPRSITEGVTLTIAVADNSEVIDWNNNTTTKMIEEEFGVNLEFEAYASTDFVDKLNVMINGGDELPDIIFGSGTVGLRDVIDGWVASGAIADLTEYYENPDYAKYINIACDRIGEVFYSSLIDTNGKIWSMPKYYPAIIDMVAQKAWVHTGHAKLLGYDAIPTDTEGFFELCKAFTDAGDLDGDGVDDEYAFLAYGGIGEGWFKFLMSPYVYAWDDYNLVVEDGNLSFAFATEEWKEGLKYIKRYFDAGILDSNAITMDLNSYKAIATNIESCYLTDIYYRPRIVSESMEEQYKACLEFTYLPSLNGADAYYADAKSIPGAVITEDCENPEAAFIVLDYMCSELMGIYQRYGEEGVDWDYYENADNSKFTDGTTKEMYKADNGEDPVFVFYDKNYWGTGSPQNAGYMLAGPGIQFNNAVGNALTGATDSTSQVVQEFNKMYRVEMTQAMLEFMPEERIVYLPMTADETENSAEAYNMMQNYYREIGAKFITGELDIDENWDAYLAELEKMGMSDALAIYQTSYDRMK